LRAYALVFPRFSGQIDYGAFDAANASNWTGLRYPNDECILRRL
jgi:hypothetical protein